MRSLMGWAVLCVSLAFPSASHAAAVTLDFESFADLTALTTEYPDLTFANATVLTAGISLNETEFPPRSGTNVIFDDGGGITVDFAQAIGEFNAYLTYVVPVTIRAFDGTNTLIGSASSAFASNLALSGDAGSSPNELLAIVAANIFRITISGDALGGSFVLDDLRYVTADGEPGPSTVPEPASLTLLALGGSLIAARRRMRRR